MKFYLGTHLPSWVNRYKKLPFFISCRSVLNRKSALCGDFILDSAGFTELLKYGSYHITEEQYLKCIEITKPKIAFCQDWMCEKIILSKTKKTIKEHQELTCRNYISLKSKNNKIQPVLQGFYIQDYINHLKMYRSFGVNENQLFGVGSICKRNTHPLDVLCILRKIKTESPDILLHGFGLKVTSLSYKLIRDLLFSADSMAWSFSGRHIHLGCDDCNSKSCANCFKYAMNWRDELLNNFIIGSRLSKIKNQKELIKLQKERNSKKLF